MILRRMHVLLIVVLGIYLVAEPALYARGMAWMMPASERARFQQTAAAMGHTLRMLMFGRVVGMVIEGLVTYVLLSFYHVPMAGLLALITGLMAFLPNIGALVSGAVMVLV